MTHRAYLPMIYNDPQWLIDVLSEKGRLTLEEKLNDVLLSLATICLEQEKRIRELEQTA